LVVRRTQKSLPFGADEQPTAVGPKLAPDEVRELMDVAERSAPTLPPPAKPKMPKMPPPRTKSGLRTRVRPAGMSIDLGGLTPAVEIEHLETDETHDIDVEDS
jgi:hypothetical protein